MPPYNQPVPAGTGALLIICPVGKASAYLKSAWLSAAVVGPEAGVAQVWFQGDDGGMGEANDRSWTIIWADGHSDRKFTQFPDGTTQVVIHYTFPQGGTFAIEAG